MPEKDQKTKSTEDTHISTGIGTDLFIRKKLPGAQIGKGYIIDIYENGIKTDTLEASTKDHVTNLIRKFKEKYQTDRAFQNELQVHITYKTKEERGEVPITVPEEKSKEPEVSLEKGIAPIEKTPFVKKEKKVKKEKTMASIDTILMKQANVVYDLMQRLLNPEIPIKIREAVETDEAPIPEELQTVSSVPETAALDESYDNKEQIKEFIVKEIISKFADFVSNRIKNAGDLEVKIDDLYNPLKSWYGSLSRAIKEWNTISKGALVEQDIKDIVAETEKVLLSKNPQLISEASGIQIDQKVADLIYEVGSKSVGKKGDADKGGVLGGNPETSKKAKNNIEKLEKNAEDKLAEFVYQIHTKGYMEPIEAIAKNLDLKDFTTLSNLYNILNKKSVLNEPETVAKKWIEEELYDNKEKNIIESHVKDFWKFAETLKGEHSIEDVFLKWLPDNKFASKEVQIIWNKIYDDVVDIFFKNKTAALYLHGNLIAQLFPQTMKAIGESVTIAVSEGKDINGFRDILDQSALNNVLLSETSNVILQNGITIAAKYIESGKNVTETEIYNSVQHASTYDNVIQGIIGFFQDYFSNIYRQGKREYRAYFQDAMVKIKYLLSQNWDSIISNFEQNIRQYIRQNMAVEETSEDNTETLVETVSTNAPVAEVAQV